MAMPLAPIHLGTAVWLMVKGLTNGSLPRVAGAGLALAGS
jgi:hypothetical protein